MFTLTITTEAEQLAILQILNVTDTPFSFTKHLAAYADRLKPIDKIEVNLSKSLLPFSYHYNPSLLAAKIKSHTLLFRSVSGQQSEKNGYIRITLYSQPREQVNNPAPRPYAHSFIGSIIRQIQEGKIILIPIKEIPDGWRRRPEQLTYNVKRNTDGHTQINIKQLKSSWRIQSK